MDYETQFLSANQRRRLLGLDPLEIKLSPCRFLDGANPDLLFEKMRSETKRFTAADLTAQCLAINLVLGPRISALIDADAFYTIGYFAIGDRVVYEFGEADILKWAKYGVPTFPTVDVHAWITLASLEIIDITLGSTTAKVFNRKELDGGVIARHAAELSGMSYHPVILGTDVLPLLGIQRAV